MSTNTTTLAFQLLAAANYIDALGGDSASYRQTLAAHDAEQAAQAVPCNVCGGSKTVEQFTSAAAPPQKVVCFSCKGSGKRIDQRFNVFADKNPEADWITAEQRDQSLRDLECPPDPETVERELAAQAVPADEPTCFGAGDVERLRAAALAVFDGPECPQIARDVIEWFYGTLLVEVRVVCASPAAPAPEAPTLTHELQQQCSDWGVYWRASDAHGVDLSIEQAEELLRRALGVEVAISKAAPQAQAAGQDGRAAFGAWFQGYRHGWKSEKDVTFDAWQARAALAQRQPLTLEEVIALAAVEFHSKHWQAVERLVRTVEKRYGIGATTGEQQR